MTDTPPPQPPAPWPTVIELSAAVAGEDEAWRVVARRAVELAAEGPVAWAVAGSLERWRAAGAEALLRQAGLPVRTFDLEGEAPPSPEGIAVARVNLPAGPAAGPVRAPGAGLAAARVAARLGARRLELWMALPGLFTADPAIVPSARLLRRLGYREALELAGLGAVPLAPDCLRAARDAGWPVVLRGVGEPLLAGTTIAAEASEAAVVSAVASRAGATVVTLRTWAMWERSGFLARFFAPFAELGLSVDLVGTSEAAVTVALGEVPGGVDGERFAALAERLGAVGRVEVVHPCAVVSVVGRRIRSVLHEIGPALAAFRERPVYLVSDSSEDVNLSFVVDEEDAAVLVARLHDDLFAARGGEDLLGPTWGALGQGREAPPPVWWRRRREELLALVADGRARYAYHPATAAAAARALAAALPAVQRLYYSMKANPHPALLAAVAAEGFGVECVSAAELRRAREVLGPAVPVLFTPNFCPLEEYAVALAAGAEVVLDGEHLLAQAPDLFRGVAVGLRVDPGRGLGHHEKVRTAGAQAKFGTPRAEVPAFAAAAAAAGVEVVGLHAHVGSGVLDPAAWLLTGEVLAELAALFPRLAWVDVGGGLGVPQRPGDAPLDLAGLAASLAALAVRLPGRGLRLEPGRYLVSEAGVLLAPVTQVRRRGGLAFVGAATGMNSLLRPALYGAWHTIHNLTRLAEPPTATYHVVGPLCESSDVLGRDRLLPPTVPGDVLLIENAGAYGAVMSSRYNLREPAEEVVVD